MPSRTAQIDLHPLVPGGETNSDMNDAIKTGLPKLMNGNGGGSVVSRRLALTGAIACCLGGMAFPHSVAASDRAAVKIVSLMLEEMGHLYRTATTESQIADGLEKIFSNYADMDVISRSVIGPPWRRVSVGEREEFTSVFKRYLSEKYSRYFPAALKGQYEIVKVVELKKDQHSVESKVFIQESYPYRIRWHVRRYRGKSLIVNLVTDEINLLSLERTVIRSLLQQRMGRMDRLIAYLPTRYAE